MLKSLGKWSQLYAANHIHVYDSTGIQPISVRLLYRRFQLTRIFYIHIQDSVSP